jgi:hypothetical protein
VAGDKMGATQARTKGVGIRSGTSARLVLALCLGLGIGFGLFEILSGRFDGDAYWNAALRLREGQMLYLPGLPDDSLVYRYPPFFAFAWVPLTYLPHLLVAALWRAAMIACALALIPLLWPRWIPAMALFVPMLIGAAWMGNVQPLVVLLAVWGVQRRRPWAVGVSAGLKALPILLAGLDAWRRDWRAVAIAVGIALALWAPIFLFDLSGYATARGLWPTDLALLLALAPDGTTQPSN